MFYREASPDVRLRSLVWTYWIVEEAYGFDEQEHSSMPERSVRLTFYAGNLWRSELGSPLLVQVPKASIEGLSLRPQRAVSFGKMRALGAELYPWGAQQLLGWSTQEQKNGAITSDLAALHARPVYDICALVELGQMEEALQTLDAWLVALWQERATEAGKGVQAAAALYESLGRTKISTLAEELNLSPRQLERSFAAQVGVSAKTLARLIRFEEVHNRIWQHPGVALGPLAYDLGFADQAHLTREFRALSNLTPGMFAQLSLLRQQHVLALPEPRRLPGEWAHAWP